jgi:adenylate cyclase
MSALTTVVFADLTGSTGVFEALGNKLATEAVTSMTQWIGSVCEAHQGRVVKTLGDGVLAVFPNGGEALAAVVEMQRVHHDRLPDWPNNMRMKLQVGVASGEVEIKDGDCYGDAVNVASRLSDLSGPEQIWATETVVDQIKTAPAGVRIRSLGPMPIRGKAETRVVYRIEWHEDVNTVNLTIPAGLSDAPAKGGPVGAGVELSWLDQLVQFDWFDLPVQLGREQDAQFVVSDQRVSRFHAKIDQKNGGFVLSDLSSFGTWLRFDGSPTEICLRRDDCVLHGSGEIALGAPFDDFTAPTVRFRLTGL